MVPSKRSERSVLLTALLGSALFIATPGVAADEEGAKLDDFYPLITRRPVLEREVELQVGHSKGSEGREVSVVSALELPLLPRWQVELDVPVVFQDPPDGPSTGGIGDIELENKFLLVKTDHPTVQLSAGFDATFPTGSERRHLGGVAAIEPFVTGGFGLGPLYLVAELSYSWNLNAHVEGPREQEVGSGVAVGYQLPHGIIPLLELTTVSKVEGRDEEGQKLLGRTQVYLSPGVNYKPREDTTLGIGVQLPVSAAREFDYAIHALVVFEF